MVQALFKTRSYGVDFFLMGKDLKKGSQVVGADGETVLEVSEAPQLLQATEVVDLQARDATLQVTPDHMVLVPGGGDAPEKYVPAGKLKSGDLIMLDSGEPMPLTSVTIRPKACDVLKVVFEPDLPVAVCRRCAARGCASEVEQVQIRLQMEAYPSLRRPATTWTERLRPFYIDAP